MKKATQVPLITLLITISALMAGLLVYHNRAEILDSSKFAMIIILTILLLIFAAYNTAQRIRDRNAGLPIEDELTTMLNLRTSFYAFRFSLALWFILFIYHAQFADVEDLLGIGMLGSAAMYGSIWFYLRYRGNVNA